MKKIFFLWIWIIFFACSAPTKQPLKKLSKDEMAKIIADLAIYNQSYIIDNQINLDETDRFVLRKYHITTKDFKENYEFHTFTPSNLDEIFLKAKKIIKEKDPNLKIEE